MAVFVDTYYNSNSTNIRWTFPSYVDPLFLTLVILLSLPGILLNPIVIKSRIARISNSIPALLTICLCGVYLVLGVFISTSWTYSIVVEDTPNQYLDYYYATAFDKVYSFVFYSGNLYSTALLYLMAFSRYRAIADPFDAVPYKEILRKVIGFGTVTAVICLATAALIGFTATDAGLIASKFDNLVVYSKDAFASWYIVTNLLMSALLVSSLEHTWRTIKKLRNADETPVETREQRRNGVKMVLILVGGQIVQVLLEIIVIFLPSNPYVAVTLFSLFQCFQASYTAVALMVMDKGTQSEVRKMLASVKRPVNEGGVVTVMETVLE